MDHDRRRVLASLGASLLPGAAFGRGTPHRPRPGAQPAPLPWADLAPPPPGTRARFTDLTGVTGDVVPNADFFVLRHGEQPELDPATFHVAIGRRGQTPLHRLSLADLARRPRKRSVVLFECCGNGGLGMHGLVGAAEWEGVALAPLLEDLLGPEAREVVFFGADEAEEHLRGNRYPARFARSLPVADALAPGVLLADSMNGEALPPEHGGPLRLIVPGWYGVSQVKWLQRIEVWPSRFSGWFQAKDYVTIRGVPTPAGVVHEATAIGRMRLKSLITRVEPAGGADLTICGLAWSDGTTPIRTVEVRVDGGAWEAAELLPARHAHGFRHFRARWRAPGPGEHRLVARAADARGVQPTDADASRYKATPWENNGQVIRRIVL